jgi:N-acyl-L-homoserine lactone synthetase|tara:strand:+ start:234 stop:470 length:237 start_codon:yes stop_codon:yes gene_type:complete
MSGKEYTNESRPAQDSAEKNKMTTDQKASLIAGGLTLGLGALASSVMIPSILREQKRKKERRLRRTGSDIRPIKPDNL